MSKDRYGTIHGDVVLLTKDAVLFALDGDQTKTQWFPLSVVNAPDELEEEDDVDIAVQTWFMDRKGIEYDG